jgi:hypothetical protein
MAKTKRKPQSPKPRKGAKFGGKQAPPFGKATKKKSY